MAFLRYSPVHLPLPSPEGKKPFFFFCCRVVPSKFGACFALAETSNSSIFWLFVMPLLTLLPSCFFSSWSNEDFLFFFYKKKKPRNSKKEKGRLYCIASGNVEEWREKKKMWYFLLYVLLLSFQALAFFCYFSTFSFPISVVSVFCFVLFLSLHFCFQDHKSVEQWGK